MNICFQKKLYYPASQKNGFRCLVLGLVYCHLYHYANNNPITYTDPNGKFIILFGGVLTAGAGVGVLEQMGTYLRCDDNNNIYFGSYNIISEGAMFGYTASVGGEITIAPWATEFSDIEGFSLVTGGSSKIPVITPFLLGASIGLEVGFNPAAEKKLKTVTIGLAASWGPGIAEIHSFSCWTSQIFEIQIYDKNNPKISEKIRDELNSFIRNKNYEGLKNWYEQYKEKFYQWQFGRFLDD